MNGIVVMKNPEKDDETINEICKWQIDKNS